MAPYAVIPLEEHHTARRGDESLVSRTKRAALKERTLHNCKPIFRRIEQWCVR